MAVLDTYAGIATVTAGAYLDIKAGAGAEAIIHNIHWAVPSGGNIELYYSNGTLDMLFDSSSTRGGREGVVFHTTNMLYYRVKNAGTASVLVSYDGVYTK